MFYYQTFFLASGCLFFSSLWDLEEERFDLEDEDKDDEILNPQVSESNIDLLSLFQSLEESARELREGVGDGGGIFLSFLEAFIGVAAGVFSGTFAFRVTTRTAPSMT